MADNYGMVTTMRRTYRTHRAAVGAGVRRAKSKNALAYVGMLLDGKFHLSDEEPKGDWRYGQYIVCSPGGRTWTGGRQ